MLRSVAWLLEDVLVRLARMCLRKVLIRPITHCECIPIQPFITEVMTAKFEEDGWVGPAGHKGPTVGSVACSCDRHGNWEITAMHGYT